MVPKLTPKWSFTVKTWDLRAVRCPALEKRCPHFLEQCHQAVDSLVLHVQSSLSHWKTVPVPTVFPFPWSIFHLITPVCHWVYLLACYVVGLVPGTGQVVRERGKGWALTINGVSIATKGGRLEAGTNTWFVSLTTYQSSWVALDEETTLFLNSRIRRLSIQLHIVIPD